jgi:hypothetical protein
VATRLTNDHSESVALKQLRIKESQLFE